MVSKKWLLSFMVLTIIPIVIVFSINYIVDPYGDNETVITKEFKPVLNERSKKYDYIFYKQNYKKYNCMILGSSRVMKITPQDNEQTKECYNFGIHIGNIAERLFLIKEWLKYSKLEKVYIGIDFYNFHKNKRVLFVSHSTFKNDTSGNYLSISALKLSIKSIINKLKNKPQTFFKNSGEICYFNKDLLIKSGKYDESNDTLNRSSNSFIYDSFIKDRFEIEDKVFDILKEIKQICKQNNIKIYTFITPMYETMILDIEKNKSLNNDFNLIRKKLKKIFPDIKDFSKSSLENKTRNNFYDAVHYRQSYAKKIINKLHKNSKN